MGSGNTLEALCNKSVYFTFFLTDNKYSAAGVLGRCNLQKNAEIQVILKTDKISRLSREWYLFLSACREYVEKINTQLDIKCENSCMTVIREVWLQEMIEQYMHWNEDIGEWQLKCVAYTGNNMRKQSPLPDKSKVCLFC